MVYRPGFLEVLGYLVGVSYPSGPSQLLEAARLNGASDEVLQVLRSLRDHEYDDGVEVSEALADADGH